MSKKIEYKLSNGDTIWLVQKHLDALAELDGSRLLSVIFEDHDLRRITNPAALFVALAVAIDAGHLRSESPDDFDDAFCYRDTPQGDHFWRGFQHLLSGRLTDAMGCFDDTDEAVNYTGGKVTITDPWGTYLEGYDYLTPTSKPTTTEPTTTGIKTMSLATATVLANKTAATAAVKIKAGQALNTAAIAAVKKSKAVPMMVRGYLDSPFAPLVVANLANAAAQYSGNAKAQKAADLMMIAAAVTAADLIDVDGIINGLFEGNKSLSTLFDKATAEE